MIKITILKKSFESDNATFVRCKLLCTVTSTSRFCKNYPFLLYDSLLYTGVAYLKKGDKFDYNVGSRIALAKAERESYKRISAIFKKQNESLKVFVKETDDFVQKANKIVNHDTEYIKKVADIEKYLKENTTIEV